MVEFAPNLMAVQLDNGGAAMLREKIVALGVGVHTSKATTAIVREADGSWLVTLTCDITERTRYYLLSFGPLLEVLEPPDVRAWLFKHAEAMARAYASDGQSASSAPR